MKIHRVSFTHQSDGHQGYTFHRTRTEAKKDAADTIPEVTGEIETFEYPATGAGMIEALNRLASHNDNG